MTLFDLWNTVVVSLAGSGITAFTIIPLGAIVGWFDYKEYPDIRKKFMMDLFYLWLVVVGISTTAWLYIGINTH